MSDDGLQDAPITDPWWRSVRVQRKNGSIGYLSWKVGPPVVFQPARLHAVPFPKETTMRFGLSFPIINAIRGSVSWTPGKGTSGLVWFVIGLLVFFYWMGQ